ncbi:hypothetical protein FOBRF1_012423 [Fusarium oxysporum]
MAINGNFPHEVLRDQQSFRLLEIEDGPSHSTINCTLKPYFLASAPSYQALSYVWGPAATANGKSIQCNGHNFFVTDNLYEALHRLRAISDCRFVWIDQICINQHDLQERSQQVSIMRDIYSQAELVNAWLGATDSPESARVVDMISTMAAGSWPRTMGIDQHLDDEKLQSLGLPPQDSPTYVALYKMLDLAYFSRVWIIQEIAVAKFYRILWGEFTIPGETFYRSTPGWLLAHIALNLPKSILAFNNAVILLQGNRVIKDWYHLVIKFKDYEATDPRDKIYALIGLADQTGYDIVVDYNKPVLEVYRDFAVKTISVTKELGILRYSTIQDLEVEKRPLWVPAFHEIPIRPIFFSRTPKASKDTKAILDTPYGQDTLSLRGVSVDTVAKIVMPETPSKELWESDKERFRQIDPSLPGEMILDLHGWGPTTWILNVFKMMDEHELVISRQNDGDLIMWLLNTLTACSDPTSMLTDFWEYLALALARFMLIRNKKSEIKLLVKLLRLLAQARPPPLEWESILDEEHHGQALRFILAGVYDNEDEIKSALELVKLLRIRPPRNVRNSFNDSVRGGRIFFITKDGYIGIGPKAMRPGDQVCVLYGGHVPFVLRPMRGAGDEDYLFLGESFVNGLMDGEALEDEMAIEKWFHLR